MGPGPDDEITDAGITIGCAKTFPESMGDIKASVAIVSAELLKIAKAKSGGAGGKGGSGSAGKKAEPSCPKPSQGTFTDARDGKEYKYATICGQSWMSENLSYEMSGSACYGGAEENCGAYGRLYNWATAVTACPLGWCLPGNAEWENDPHGFAAAPGGYRSMEGGFGGAGELSYWWTATEDESDETSAYSRHMGSIDKNAVEKRYSKTFGFSVRCVKGSKQTYEEEEDDEEEEDYEEDEYEYRHVYTGIEKDKKSGASLGTAIAFDLVGAAFLAYGVMMHFEAKDAHDRYMATGKAWKSVEDLQKTRNISYIIGGSALGIGLGIHIFF